MNNSSGSERDFERLSKAITEAVMKSEKVRKLVGEILKKEKICPQSFMLLVLNMQTLSDAFESGVPDEAAERKPVKRARKGKAAAQGQFIDGSKLSKNEQAFEEFASRKFDPEEWLRRNRLIL